MKTKEFLTIHESFIEVPTLQTKFKFVQIPANVITKFMEIPEEWKPTLNENFGHVFSNPQKMNFLFQMHNEPNSKVMSITECFNGFEFKPYLIGLLKKYKYVKITLNNNLSNPIESWLIIKN